MDEFSAHIELAQAAPLVDSQQLLAKIYGELDDACANEFKLEQSWTRLGGMLLEFKQGEHWRKTGFEGFPEFMLTLRDRYNRGKTQLWSYLTVVENLLPAIGAETLEEIGISKALELKRAVKKSGKAIPQEIIELARKQATTIKQLRAELGAAFNIEPGEKGTWFDFDGCFMTPEERKEFLDAIRLTKTLLAIGNDVPEHIQRKEIFTTWAKEFVGTHAAEVYGPKTIIGTPATLVLPGKEVSSD